MTDRAEWNDFNGKTKNGKTVVHFYERDVQNPVKTLSEGRPIFETKIYIEKICPGDTLNRIDRMMRDTDKQEFPDEWEKFQRKEKHVIEGTPLEAWPQISRIQALEMKAMNIMTVEHLANLADVHAHKIMGFTELKRKAQTFLKAASDSSLFDKMNEDNQAKDAMLKQQSEAIAALQTQMAELTAKKKPGRKAKVDADAPSVN